MTADISTTRQGSTANFGEEHRLRIASQVAGAVKNRWRRGEAPSLAGALADHPELRYFRSVVLDLAYTEYQVRLQSGEPLDAAAFSQQYPSLEKSLYMLIAVHGMLSQDPELQGLQERLAWPEAGSHFLQFDLIAEIGRGAFGQVFLATEAALGGRRIVVKIAPHAGGEAEILGKLQHPNIVPIYSLHEDEETGLAAFCMPYLGQATLGDVLDHAFATGGPPLRARVILDAIASIDDDDATRDAPIIPRVLSRGSYVDGVIYLASQLADALAHSHGRGIYHRDIKPSNVLMTADGRPLLLDFNLSVDVGLPTWKIGGTLPYMAPEELAHLVRKRPDSAIRHYDPRSDVFSLGVIIYELLTGRLPFGTIPRDGSIEETADQLRQWQAEGPRPIRDRNPQVDRRLAQLVENCLAFDAENRPETAQQLAVALRHELSPVRRGRRWVGNHRKLVFSASAVLLSVTLAVSLFLSLRPSYDTRQLQFGLAYCERGEYALALECLNDAIRANPASTEALFARGQAYQRLGRFDLALLDYDAKPLASSPIALACQAYCLSQLKSPLGAIGACRRALDAGYKSPAVLLNNMGFSHLQRAQTNVAEKELQQAIELDDRMQAAHYNMLSVFLQRAVPSKPTPIPPIAFVHAAKAMDLGPCTAELYFTVANLYAVAAKTDATLIQPAILYTGKAVELGCDPKRFEDPIIYSAMHQDPTFAEALKKPVLAQIPVAEIRLVDPLSKL